MPNIHALLPAFQQCAVDRYYPRHLTVVHWECQSNGDVFDGKKDCDLFSESRFLNVFEQQWDGSAEPARAFAALDAYLRRIQTLWIAVLP